VCDQTQTQCGAADQSYYFYAGQIPFADPIACGGATGPCFAGLGSYAIVGTTQGLAAWDVSNPFSPLRLAALTVPFTIDRITADSTRVVLWGVSGGKLHLGWVDAPGSGATALHLQTADLAFPYATFGAAYPAPGGHWYVVQIDSTTTLAGEVTIPPSGDLAMVRLEGMPPSANVVASSGARLVVYREGTGPGQTGQDPWFSFETNVALSSSPSHESEEWHAGTDFFTDPDQFSARYGPSTFSQTPGGGVLWSVGELPASQVLHNVLWVLSDSAGNFRNDVYATFAQDNAGFASPTGAIDDHTVLVTGATHHDYPTDGRQTTVRILTRNGDKVTILPQSQTLEVTPASVAIATAAGFGLVLTPPAADAGAAGGIIHLFAPSCDQ
jgi:hypothetical protein